ncbi:class II fructose-bisphosphate aldolase [Salibacterium qingdaonense]|uniref:Fructose-bisphosphate aldolase, class II n=1 Tax=Salibacterium qingdaonense TaxID=266892 RepID=A0A1I4NIT3_9BACI|nr:class II fructose-bisphosphate aldolase [Salibacterium qingdaonense]SFM15376.1 fructose-bisphosphate aldolase, class II [Salibacterium qingdaonense]
MPFLSGKVMLEHAFHHGYGVGAFSAHNAETVQAIVEAAEEEQAPIMIQVGQKVIQTLEMEPMKMLIDWYGRNASVPICIHLDHSRNFSQTMRAVQLGFQSVMFDGSALSFEENTALTRKTADIAASLNIGSEGEIGKIGGTEDDITVDEKDAMITRTEEAAAFVEATDVDYLAASLGTAHGIYRKTPNVRLDRLEEIVQAVKRPVVLHGGSDVPDEQVQRAISLGVAKINVDTELRQAFTRGVQEVFAENKDEFVVANSLGRGKEKMKEKVKEKIHIFGSHQKAENLLTNKEVL